MPRILLLIPLILLALNIPEQTHALIQKMDSPGPVDSFPQVNHPLIYRPSSLSSPGAPPFVPSDVRRAYDFMPLYKQGVNGNGTKIAIIDAFGDPKVTSDLSSFDSLTGLGPATLSIHYPDGVPTLRDSGWALETALDVEWVHAIAPNATIDLVVALDSSIGHVFDGISFVANSLTGETALSMSFGLAESQYPSTGSFTIPATHQLFVTMTGHGTTPFASSGDNGASNCCTSEYPASDPLVVAVGGTTLTLNSSASYVGETTWSGSTAGSSVVFGKPAWQHGLGDSMRDDVDISYDADPNTGVLVVEAGKTFQVGGTSAGSPQWAALAALASQANGVRYGSIASRLYALHSYHDVTSGSDGFFSAGPGWDYPTGLGSPDASLLVSSLQPPVAVRSSTIFQGLNITTTGSVLVNGSNSTVSGTAMVRATNATTNSLVYAKNYTVTNVRLTNQTMGQTARFVLAIPVTPYPLSAEITLTIKGTSTSTQVLTTRRVNVSGGDIIGIVDISIIELDYGTSVGTPNYNPGADLNADGMVTLVDIAIANLYYGSHVFS